MPSGRMGVRVGLCCRRRIVGILDTLVPPFLPPSLPMLMSLTHFCSS